MDTSSLNTVTNIGLSLNYFQMGMVAIIGALFLISAVKWLAKKPTGAFEVMLIVSVPVILWAANFFSKPEIQRIFHK